MKAIVEIPSHRPVVVSERGSRYHRQSDIPFWETACKSRFSSDLWLFTRREAEAHGYGPCTHSDCFGRHAGD